jgi:hypothetical protein
MKLSKAEQYFSTNFPSYRDFVDDALFHPEWGYYSRGLVQFGEGGHYDTYPNALSPLFGRMVANYAHHLAVDAVHVRDLRARSGNGSCASMLFSDSSRAAKLDTWKQFAEDSLSHRRAQPGVDRTPAPHARATGRGRLDARRSVTRRARVRCPSDAPVFSSPTRSSIVSRITKSASEGCGTGGDAAGDERQSSRCALRPIRGFSGLAATSSGAPLMNDEDLRNHVSFHEVQVALGACPSGSFPAPPHPE